jgi:hypothetical protein
VYNVAYVKHNRFLSPSQKAAVSPKVTEVIPISSEKHIIYGKPKVKISEDYDCPEHDSECPPKIKEILNCYSPNNRINNNENYEHNPLINVVKNAI